jgi:hypothetical protein
MVHQATKGLDVNVVEQQLALLADRAADRKLRFGMARRLDSWSTLH